MSALEAEADSRGRVCLAKAGARPGRRYRIEDKGDGTLMLTPVVSVDEREMYLYGSPAVYDAVLRGLAEAERGETVYLGSIIDGTFKYLADADDWTGDDI